MSKTIENNEDDHFDNVTEYHHDIERDRLAKKDRMIGIFAPLILMVALIGFWEVMVRINNVPHYILPAPSLILTTLFTEFSSLMGSMWFTVKLTVIALLLAIIGGILLAGLFAVSRVVEASLFPYAIILQVTPVIAIAPLILIYIENNFVALLLIAWIVSFFPILSNTVIGLKSADHNLTDLFKLYRATPWQKLRYLLMPTALPYFIAGLKIAGGLALIGAVVAEFVAGSAGRNTGLASRILESSFRFEIPKMFAALILICLLGLVIYLITKQISKMTLGHWHESERKR